MSHDYLIQVMFTTDSDPQDLELQHLAFRAADEVLTTIIDDGRVTLKRPIEFSYEQRS